MSKQIKYKIPKGFLFILDDLKLKTHEVEKIAGFPEGFLLRKDNCFTSEDFFSFWEACDFLYKGDIHLEVSRYFNTQYFDPVIFSSLCSENFELAIEQIKTYRKLIGPIDLIINKTKNEYSIKSKSTILKKIPDILKTGEAFFFTTLIRIGTRKDISPKKITFPPIKSIDNKILKYKDFFNIDIEIGNDFEIVFDRKDTLLKFKTEDTELWNLLKFDFNKKLKNIEDSITFTEKVRLALMELLPTKNVSIEVIASKLALSKRTLQRRLNEENTSFNNILDNMRKDLAIYYIQEKKLQISEISFLLGYKDKNSFYRAFKKWTNISPKRFKEGII